MKYYFVNRLANNGIKPNLPDGANIVDAVETDYKEFFNKLEKDDEVVFVGGDGTINHLVNELDGYEFKNNLYLLANGTGNDFINDINETVGKEIPLNKYLTHLPTVKVKDIERKFINNMGFGIDGYCCEIADRIKEKTPNKKINYTLIAIKGLLYDFKSRTVDIEVDGKKYHYDNVWLAPTMKGRFYGGGMMVAPNQDRFSDELTVVVYTCKSKLKSLLFFPSIFKGEHVKHTDVVKIITGKKVHVKYSRPCAAQIDGDTVLDVLEYWAELD